MKRDLWLYITGFVLGLCIGASAATYILRPNRGPLDRPHYTTSALPKGAAPGELAVVTDSLMGCKVGGGHTTLLCVFNGEDWIVVTGGMEP